MKKRRQPARTSGFHEEQGAIVKRGRGLTRVALVYPNTYRAGMSCLGFQTVYRLANQNEAVACERVFLPDTRRKTNGIFSLETGLHLDQFDMILFSISFENDFLNLARMLRAAGLPLRSSNRHHIHPLVAAGGVACTLNPEPIAPFMDLFLLGEAECLLTPFFDAFHQAGSKKALISGIETSVPGAYVPGAHTPILYPLDENVAPGLPPANVLPDASKAGPSSASPVPPNYQIPPNPPSPALPDQQIQVQYLDHLDDTVTTTAVMTEDTAFKDTFLVEILKGCPHGCRFCTAGFIYRPPRVYPTATILTAIDQAREKTDRIGLVSSAILDHPDIDQICQYGRDKGMRISFSSLRADKLDRDIIASIAESNVKTATIAPEAGSQRMRDIINKKLSRDQILQAAQNLVAQGIINLRLYFMIGLPFETGRDVQAIVDLALDIKTVFLDASRKNKRMGTITLSINPFIPKPSTPFQWSGMTQQNLLEKRMEIIRQGLKKTANIALNFESLRQSRIDALLSLGDRRTADLIEQALDHGWTKTFRLNKTYCQQVIHTEKSMDIVGERSSSLPWNILAHPVSDAFLFKEYLRGKEIRTSPSCPMKPCHECRRCMAKSD